MREEVSNWWKHALKDLENHSKNFETKEDKFDGTVKGI